MSASQIRPKCAKVRVHFSKFEVRPKVRVQDFHIIINARVSVFVKLVQIYCFRANIFAQRARASLFLFFWSNIQYNIFSSAF